jgi:hypothetical protein
MQGSLGEKIGEGAFSDVHAWAPAQVVKLFKSGTPRRLSWHEARVTRAVFAAGAAAPEGFGEVSVEGCFGIEQFRRAPHWEEIRRMPFDVQFVAESLAAHTCHELVQANGVRRCIRYCGPRKARQYERCQPLH